MIPRFRVSPRIDVDLAEIRPPPMDVIHCEGGLSFNHDYVYIQGVTWRVFKKLYEVEGRAIAFLDSRAKNSEEFDELAEELTAEELSVDDDWDKDYFDLAGFTIPDLGIASVVCSLYAFKCYPITSCRGHPGERGARHPLVVFFCEPQVAPLLVGVAAGSHVGMENEYLDEADGALIVYAQSIVEMRNFAMDLSRASRIATKLKCNLRKSTGSEQPKLP